MNLPLSGIRVLDLSQYLPGPFCSQILADFGAEIIKVEPPKRGELGRQVPPLIESESARFYTVNRNKKSITLDLKKEEGKSTFKKLLLTTDVVLDQFRPGVMEKMGLGYEVQKEINERIIYCAITGYGLDGPLRDTAGHDLNFVSLSGITESTGTHKGIPAMSGVQIADIAGGTLYAVIAILLALLNRDKTGKGQLCDIAMLDCSISLLTYTLGEWSGMAKLPERGNEVLTGGYAFFNIYETKDEKFISLAAVEDKFWAKFCEMIDRKDYISDQWNKEKQNEIKEDIKNIFLEKTRDEWVEYFSNSDICFTPVLNLEEMSTHPQVVARNMIEKITNFKNSGKDLVLTGIPIKLSESPGQTQLTFPKLGEHNEEILKEAGYTHEEIEKLRKNQVI
ncbi:Alpha-methylacyl-CoA racemase [Candidatus Syntrophocurvum alkaliphilum]|uniref:Alpha-methylacyl-CoA racemase n=1 Tax=Candidatus Syntrophocurvum alkaliphilum TaxID=2293317 RepID=A0A6I6DDR4_9FIRM|nr:CaiB/BaiF CoA-transferase family protein [Candidatus Syntrophocurvum alkaliphilum]QGT99347.1 Alpha-methylacyl-CoA racemase [Candidatus Syntrophocurvum alkaliphilum]